MNRKTLIIDDCKIILDLLANSLAANGLEIDTYESADKAMTALSQDRLREFGLIMTDLDLPGTRGDDFLIRMHALNPNSKKFLISGAIECVTAEARLIATLVRKPFSIQSLMQQLAEQKMLPSDSVSYLVTPKYTSGTEILAI